MDPPDAPTPIRKRMTSYADALRGFKVLAKPKPAEAASSEPVQAPAENVATSSVPSQVHPVPNPGQDLAQDPAQLLAAAHRASAVAIPRPVETLVVKPSAQSTDEESVSKKGHDLPPQKEASSKTALSTKQPKFSYAQAVKGKQSVILGPKKASSPAIAPTDQFSPSNNPHLASDDNAKAPEASKQSQQASPASETQKNARQTGVAADTIKQQSDSSSSAKQPPNSSKNNKVLGTPKLEQQANFTATANESPSKPGSPSKKSKKKKKKKRAETQTPPNEADNADLQPVSTSAISGAVDPIKQQPKINLKPDQSEAISKAQKQAKQRPWGNRRRSNSGLPKILSPPPSKIPNDGKKPIVGGNCPKAGLARRSSADDMATLDDNFVEALIRKAEGENNIRLETVQLKEERTRAVIDAHDKGNMSNSLWDSQYEWDVMVKCRDTCWRVHHEILSRESDWFKKRLPPKDPHGGYVKFHCHAHTKEQLGNALKFMYDKTYENSAPPPNEPLNGASIPRNVFMFICGASVNCRSLMDFAADAIDNMTRLVAEALPRQAKPRSTDLFHLYHP
ncbi:hypothetical protein B0T17DRAFT_616899 [Bombardia bombarda]|uniref:BTB domain-containing protein n=1 Tax=Bombardia bombarda TaxID=252184 RepID=A0AA40C4G5_9PEZI|nr:hypothetical protein B0T17DRAFT_616899 [Bombardia bombarda]